MHVTALDAAWLCAQSDRVQDCSLERHHEACIKTKRDISKMKFPLRNGNTVFVAPCRAHILLHRGWLLFLLHHYQKKHNTDNTMPIPAFLAIWGQVPSRGKEIQDR